VWPNVKDAVDHYITFYNRRKHKEAEQKFLQPFGFDQKSFNDEQKNLAPKVAEHLAAEMIGYDVEYEVETIFTGVDDSGAHIYQIVENEAMCCDPVGFAAIGSGGRHAESQFMLSRHSSSATLDETLFLLHSAKKESEVAPGVGAATDMFTIGPNKGTFAWLGGTAWPAEHKAIIDMKRLDKIYDTAKTKRNKVAEEAKKEIKGYVDEIRKAGAKASIEQPVGKDARVAGVSAKGSVGETSVATEKNPKPAPTKGTKRKR